MRLVSFFSGVAILAASLAVSFAAADAPAGVVRLEWNFDRPGDLQGWQPNGDLRQVGVTNGVLSATAVGDDPILELRPLIDLPASPWQCLELRLKASHEGKGEVFWTGTTQTKYGGFSGEKTTRFQAAGGGQWQTLRLFPFWHSEKKIIRLRLDLYAATSYEIDFIRIVELPHAAAPVPARFDFAAGAASWRPLGSALLAPTPAGLRVETPASGDFILAPPVRVDAEENSFVSLRLTATNGQWGRLFFATEQSAGLHSFRFPLVADGQEHVYNIDMLPAEQWKGRIIALGLRPVDAPGGQALLRSLSVAGEPQGPPQLEVRAFAVAEAAQRVGIVTRLSAMVLNTGGDPASNLVATVRVPAGARILSSPAPELLRRPVIGGGEVVLDWEVRADQPVRDKIRLELSAPHVRSVAASESVDFQPLPANRRSDYVPVPQPVRGPYDVGAYYFPGWKTASQWQPLQRFPERRAVLGTYCDGAPEIADWHIKWAVEHGITYFAYDWYWSKGARHLEHGLHDGFFQARYRNLLKFCLLWANHNPSGSHSFADSLEVTRYWITNYFNRPEYYRIDGKPVVVIFSPYNFRSDMGVEEVNRAFAAMRAECLRAGLPGLHLSACVGGAGQVKGQHYDSVTAYNWPGLGAGAGEKQAPYATMAEGYRRQWDQILEKDTAPLLLPISGGWDSRPWHGDSALVRHTRTPEVFKAHLRDAWQLLESRPAATNLLRSVLVEAWNEWGEGSYIEPHKEYGFGYLDAIRDVFVPGVPPAHTDLTPVDVGLTPCQVKPEAGFRSAWSFKEGLQGWDNTMQTTPPVVREGRLSVRTTGTDAAFFSPPMQAAAAQFSRVVIRLRLTGPAGGPAGDTAQLFWQTRRWPENEASSQRFAVKVDGQWHDYSVPVRENRRWQGIVTRLRLDPGNRPDIAVEMESLLLE
jgi:hypothetical protein